MKMALFLFAVAAAANAAEINLLPEGDFESGTPGRLVLRRIARDTANREIDAPSGAITDRFQSEFRYGGKSALELSNLLTGGGHEFHFAREFVAVRPGEHYRWSCLLHPLEKNDNLRVTLLVSFWNRDDKVVRYRTFNAPRLKAGEWQNFTADFTIPPNGVKLSFVLWFQRGPYRLVVDNLSLVKVNSME